MRGGSIGGEVFERSVFILFLLNIELVFIMETAHVHHARNAHLLIQMKVTLMHFEAIVKVIVHVVKVSILLLLGALFNVHLVVVG